MINAAANVSKVDEAGERAFAQLLKRCTRTWQSIGEKEALKKLDLFVEEKIDHYELYRDYPSITGTSKLSPFLKVGAISPRTILFNLWDKEDKKGGEAFIKELAWRDFYHMIHYYYPNCKDQEVRAEYQAISWNQNKHLLEAWCEGETGFPIIDAGMRQLKKEGWMHNRLRMITASFLTKDYLIDWRLGERYFEKMLN